MINPPCICWSSNFRRCWTEILVIFSRPVCLVCCLIIVRCCPRILVDVLRCRAVDGNSCELTIIGIKSFCDGDALIFGDFVLRNRRRHEIVHKIIAGIFGQHPAPLQWILWGMVMSKRCRRCFLPARSMRSAWRKLGHALGYCAIFLITCQKSLAVGR